MTQTRNSSVRFITRKRLGISLAVVVAMIALFGLLGYYWLPGYAKSQLEMRLSALLERPVSVQAIGIEPYALKLTVSGFHIGEKAGNIDAEQSFVAFDKLYIDISSESFIQRAPVISTITLDSLRARLSRESEHQFNFSDLIEKFSQPSDEDNDTAALFSVSNIILKNGHIEWVDHFNQNHQTISEINFAIPFVANLDKVKANWIEPHFSAKINDAPFLLEGRLRPFTDQREASLALELQDVNLTRIAEYIPLPTGISLISAYFDSSLTLAFAQVGEEAPTVTLSGETGLRRVAVRNETVQRPYQFDLENLRIRFDQADLTGRKPIHLIIGLDNVAMIPLSPPVDKKAAVFSLPQLGVDDMMIDLSNRQVVLNGVTLDGLNSIVNREEDGGIDLARFFAPSDTEFSANSDLHAYVESVPKPSRKPSHEAYEAWRQLAARQEILPETGVSIASTVPVPERKPAYKERVEVAIQDTKADSKKAAWVFLINRFRLNDAAIRYADLTLDDVAPMVISPLDLSVQNIDINGVKPLDMQLNAQVNQRGHIETSGTLAWSPLAADLNLAIKAVDLVSLQGWVGDALNVLLTSGDISFQGTVRADSEPLKVTVNGDGRLANFNLFDPKNTRDLMRWKDLDISGLDFANMPLKVNIDTVKVGDFFVHIILLPGGELNLKQIVQAVEKEESTDAQVQTVTDEAEEHKPMPLHIGKIVLQQGNVDFHDRFVKPNYHANLTGLAGQIGPIHFNRTGAIDIKGTIDRTAPLEIRGSIEPFGSELMMDIIAKAKEIDLPPFSTYSGKYVGYDIEKGKLSVDVHYHVEQGTLTAENNVFLDQFTLGERVESKEAVSLPLELAIALLKNRRGEIDIHLPIKGSIDDPQFSLGSIILDAFINLITRAVTAPFTLLGSMLGDGESLSEIPFKPGRALIETESADRLQALSQILKDRPALSLEIAGHVDPVSDREGLKQVILQRKVKAQKLAADTKEGITTDALAGVKLTPEEYSKYLEIVYKEADFEKPTNFFGFTKSLPDAEMEQMLLEHIDVSDDDMLELAQNRALAAQNWLLDKGGISGDRLFVLGMQKSAIEDAQTGNRVEFVLK